MINLNNYELNTFINAVYEMSSKGERVLVEMYGYKMYIMPYLSKNMVRIVIKSELECIKKREINLEKLKRLDAFSEEKYFEIEKYSPDTIRNMLSDLSQYDNIGHSKK